MKRFLTILLITSAGLGAFCFNLSCSTSTPTSATNFQNPAQTIVAINPSFTFTRTFTSTATFTSTPTFTPTSTPTPYVTTTWTGFSAPSGIAVDGSGNVYVADTGNNMVEKYYPNGLLNPGWGTAVKGKVSVTNPVAVAANSAGTTIYVVGNTTHALGVFTGNGSLFTQITIANSITFLNPQGVAVDNSGNVYVSDTGNQRIVEFNSAGSYATSFSTGVSVLGIALDSSGDIFGAAGNTVLEFVSGSLNTTIPGFNNPNGVAVNSANNLFVADTGNRQIEEFASSGLSNVPLVIFNGGGQLVSPKGVAVDSNGNIYVADSGANSVFKFTP